MNEVLDHRCGDDKQGLRTRRPPLPFGGAVQEVLRMLSAGGAESTGEVLDHRRGGDKVILG